MKLIDRTRNFLTLAVKKHKSRVAERLLMAIGMAHVFMLGKGVLSVGQQALGKLPWKSPKQITLDSRKHK